MYILLPLKIPRGEVVTKYACMYVSCGVFIAQLLDLSGIKWRGGGGHKIICRAQGYTSAFYEKLGKTNIYGNVSSNRFAVRY